MSSKEKSQSNGARRSLIALSCFVVAAVVMNGFDVFFYPKIFLEPRPSQSSETLQTWGSEITSSEESASMIKFKVRQQRAAFCLKHRGDKGRWVEDLDYAANLPKPPKWVNQSGLSHAFIPLAKHKPTVNQEYLWESTWRWEDKTCQTHLLSRENLCRACHHLGVSRILVIGDSLSGLFTRTLRYLMGYPWHSMYGESVGSDLVIECPAPYPPIRQKFVRSDEPAGTGEVAPANEIQEFVLENKKRTATVLNVGAHCHNQKYYKDNLKMMLDWVDSLNRTNDIVFFRYTTPGHGGCLPREAPTFKNYVEPVRVVPLETYEEYTNSDPYTWIYWSNFEQYNKIAKNAIRDRGQSQTPIHILNVFNSTILRRDGHRGGNDCLHYTIPGPIDWWLHFFQWALLDLAELEQK